MIDLLGARFHLLALACLGLLLALPAPAENPRDDATAFEFQELNRSYSTLLTGLQPLRQGPLTVHLVSPRNVLTVEEHRLSLTPADDGSHRGRVEARILGEGLLVAEIEISGAVQTLEDEVVVPRQTVALQTRLRIERAATGYRVTTLELPAQVEIEVRSQLAQAVVSTCRALALLPLMPLDCAAVERSLSRIGVPLPAAGSSYLLSVDRLTAEERSRLDEYLKRTAATQAVAPP